MGDQYVCINDEEIPVMNMVGSNEDVVQTTPVPPCEKTMSTNDEKASCAINDGSLLLHFIRLSLNMRIESLRNQTPSQRWLTVAPYSSSIARLQNNKR